jgi:hypothetical protein
MHRRRVQLARGGDKALLRLLQTLADVLLRHHRIPL